MTGPRRLFAASHAALAATVASLLTAGCSGETIPLDSGASVRDSASVRIVTSPGEDRLLATKEVLRLGMIDGDPNHLFDRIRSLGIDSDGSIWVSDMHPSIRRYSAEGEFLASAGGAGEGPGESPRGYGDLWLGDSVVVVIPNGPELQLFDLAGNFVAARPLMTGSSGPAYPVGFAQGVGIFREEIFPDDAGDRLRTRWALMVGTLDRDDATPVLTVPGVPRRRSGRSFGSGSYLDGFPSLGVSESGIFYTDATDYEVRLFDVDGRLATIVRRLAEPTPVNGSFMDGVEEEVVLGWAETMGTMSGNPISDASLNALVSAVAPVVFPEHLPFLQQVLPAPDGSFWVRRADKHPNPQALAVARAMGFVETAWPERWRADPVFDLFDTVGGYRGTVALPQAFTALVVTGDRVYGSMTDEFGVGYVVAFEIESPPST